MATVKNTVDLLKCPYRVVREVAFKPFKAVEERFDFQFAENGKIEIISLGEFDLVKEVESHKGEVGLLNRLAIAQSRGLPLDSFAKTEPGVMADVGDIETFDDLVKAQADAENKLSAIAKQFGITTEQLIAIAKAGKLDSLTVANAEDENKEGDD